MGNSLASKRIRKKLQRMLYGCEERHIFKGLLGEFDTVEPVPRERVVRGMLVDTPNGERLVNFCPSVESTSVVPLSSLDAGDIVVVFGTKDEHRKNATFPHLIALPEEHILLVPEEPPRSPNDSGDRTAVLFYGIITVLDVFLFFLGLFLNIPILAYFAALFLSISAPWAAVFLGERWYHKHSRRARVFRFDSDQWVGIVAFIKDRITVYKANIFDE